eukprot:TRINITY_DN3632_c0_g1_i1.p1 TRINITY_DN3632_c0_g1~~TRINITY_DN3632_c0_g1_i1.p1  ORF type:complete len:87 (-),score=5.60 TRINITY_DN3632_c0_g1_i1:206-466(-)
MALGTGIYSQSSSEKMQENMRGELTEIQHGKFSINSKTFVHAAYHALHEANIKYLNSDSTESVLDILWPVVMCSAAGSGALTSYSL